MQKLPLLGPSLLGTLEFSDRQSLGDLHGKIAKKEMRMSFKSVMSVAGLVMLLCASQFTESQNTALPNNILLPDGFRP